MGMRAAEEALRTELPSATAGTAEGGRPLADRLIALIDVHRTLHAARRCGCHLDTDSRRRVQAAASALATLRWSQRRKAWRLVTMLADRQLVVFTAVGSLLGVVRVAVNKLRYRFYGGAFKLLRAATRASDATTPTQSLVGQVIGLGVAWGWVKVVEMLLDCLAAWCRTHGTALFGLRLKRRLFQHLLLQARIPIIRSLYRPHVPTRTHPVTDHATTHGGYFFDASQYSHTATAPAGRGISSHAVHQPVRVMVLCPHAVRMLMRSPFFRLCAHTQDCEFFDRHSPEQCVQMMRDAEAMATGLIDSSVCATSDAAMVAATYLLLWRKSPPLVFSIGVVVPAVAWAATRVRLVKQRRDRRIALLSARASARHFQVRLLASLPRTDEAV